MARARPGVLVRAWALALLAACAAAAAGEGSRGAYIDPTAPLPPVPEDPETAAGYGITIGQQIGFAAAIPYFERAAAMGKLEHFLYLAECYLQAGDQAAAKDTYELTLAMHPNCSFAATQIGDLLFYSGQISTAIDWYTRGVEAEPAAAAPYAKRAMARQWARDARGALDDAAEAVRLAEEKGDPLLGPYVVHYVNVALDCGEHGRAHDAARRAYRRGHTDGRMRNLLLYNTVISAAKVAAWRDWDELLADLEELVGPGAGGPGPGPYESLRGADVDPVAAAFLPYGPATQLAVARRRACPPLPPMPHAAALAAAGPRVRLAYVSVLLLEHATGFVFQHVPRLHDRSRFEVFAYVLCPRRPDDPVQRNIVDGADHVVFVGSPGYPSDLAQAVNDDGIQVLIYLDMFILNADCAPIARSPAPVQVFYTSYGGPSGADGYLSHFVGDPLVSTPEMQAHFTEKLLLVPPPASFHVASHYPLEPHTGAQTDGFQTLPPHAVRSLYAIPPDAVVLAAFHPCKKLTPGLFGLWMNVLRRAPGALLWVFTGVPELEANLLLEAAAAGLVRRWDERGPLAPRLVYAPFVPRLNQVERMMAADLFLDSPHFGAQSTMLDALWAGLPPVTLPGPSLASRTAASMLRAAGLERALPPCASLKQYEDAAVRWAADPAARAAARAAVAAARARPGGLFDTRAWVRALEAPLAAAWEAAAAAAPPHHFFASAL